MQRRLWPVLATVVFAAACASGGAQTTAPTSTTTSTTTTSTSTTTTIATTTTTTTTAPPPSRHLIEQAWIPFAVGGDVTLHYPSSRVEHVGFHESNDAGAQHLEALSGVAATTLEDRGRGTDRQGSADVVVDPDSEIR